MESPSTESLKNAIKIAQTPYHYRTLDETNTLMAYLSRFDFFRNKVGDRGLEDVLQLASKYVRHTRIPAGEFLYHVNQHSNHLYFILHGEAWKFRPSTEIEFERDEAASKKSATKEAPKILQAIALAKASADRNKNPNLAILKRQNSPSRKSIAKASQNDSPQKPQISLLNLGTIDYTADHKIDKTSPTKKNLSQLRNRPEDMNKIKAGLLKKLKDTKNAMNFENDYFHGLVNRNPGFSKLYMREKVVTMKFDMKFNLFETIGEVSMSLTQVRTTSVLAYSDVHLFYLDQKNYERVFYAQIEAVQEKLTFFKDYFKDVAFDTFKRLAFLFAEKRYNLGEVVYKEDDPSSNLYFIKSGEVQLFKTVKPKENATPEFNNDLSIKCNFSNKLAKQVSVGNVPSGLFFGEELLLKQKKRLFTAKSTSNLHCYIIRNEVVSRFPLHVIHKLREMSTSKQNWIEDRLKNLQNLPLFKNIQRRIEHQNSPNELSINESHHSNEKVPSFNHIPSEKNLKTETQRENHAPLSNFKRNDLTIKVSPNNPDYGTFNNVIQSFSTSFKSEKPEDKTLRYYNPSFSPNTTKRKTFFPVDQSLKKPKSQLGHRLISYSSLKKIPRVGTSGHLSGFVSPNDKSRNTPKTKTRTNYKIKIDSDSNIPSKTQLNQTTEPQKQADIAPDTLVHLDNSEEDFNFNFVAKKNSKTENILSIIENPMPTESPQQKALEDKLKRLSVFSSMKRAKPEIHSQGASVERNDAQTMISVTNKSFRLPNSPSIEKKFVMYLSQKHFLSPIQKSTVAAESCNSIEDSKFSSPKFNLSSSSVIKPGSRNLDGSLVISRTSFLIQKKPLLMLPHEKRSKGM